MPVAFLAAIFGTMCRVCGYERFVEAQGSSILVFFEISVVERCYGFFFKVSFIVINTTVQKHLAYYEQILGV